MRGTTDAGEDTREAILEATYRALCEHGYADLTMQDIADESETSTASLHYHFDTKEDLFLSFLDHMYEAFVAEHGDPDGEDAVERLVAFVDGVLCRSDPEREEAFGTALLEIKAQAPYVDAYRRKLSRVDAFVRDEVEDLLVEGIEEEVVRESVDPEDAAAFVATTIVGVNTRRVAVGETDGGTRRAFLRYVREHLLAEGTDLPERADPSEEADLPEETDDDPTVDGAAPSTEEGSG